MECLNASGDFARGITTLEVWRWALLDLQEALRVLQAKQGGRLFSLAHSGFVKLLLRFVILCDGALAKGG